MFHALFAGLERAHGAYNNITLDQERSDGKRKGIAVTKREPVTDDLWAQHLAGKYGIGIIPIRDDSTCVFGAIDIDVYADLDPARIAATVARMGLPLVVCRSKSGGVHLYAFSSAPVPAIQMQQKLQAIAARLGHGTCEVYPKQTVILIKEKDLGSWINCPYFDAASTTRYAVKPSGDAMTAEEFLEAAARAKQPADWFAESLAQNVSALPDGPPCLQHLMEQGFPPGTWNDGTFNLGVYCRKARPDDWKQHLAELNAKNFPPDKWPVSDLNPIVKSLEKKSYAYSCSRSPLKDHCDRVECRKRKFGVGGANALPVLSSLTKLCTTPPTWFLEVENRRLKLTTAELLNPLAFQERCCEHNIIVPVVGRGQWTEYLRPAMASVTEIPVADDGSAGDDSSPRAIFNELLDAFVSGRAQADSLEQVRMGKPYTADGVTQFRLTDLMTFMGRKGFKNFQRNEVVAMLKDQGAKNREQSVCGKSTRLWIIPYVARPESDLPVPDAVGEHREF